MPCVAHCSPKLQSVYSSDSDALVNAAYVEPLMSPSPLIGTERRTVVEQKKGGMRKCSVERRDCTPDIDGCNVSRRLFL